MKIAEISKEFSDDDVKRYKKSKRKVPHWLFGREAGTQIRVKDADFQENKEFLQEVKPPRKKGTVSESADA